MPADPLADVSAGDDLTTTALSAARINAVAEMARRVRAGLGRNPPKDGDPPVPALEVLVRNDTGGDLDEFSVVTPGTPLEDASADPFLVQRRPSFGASAPAAAEDPFFVLAEPVPDGEVGRAVVLGVTVARVNLSDTSHNFAVPAAATTATLASSLGGPARILWRASSLGSSVLCVVELTGAWPIRKQRVVTQIGCDGSDIQYTWKYVWVVDIPV